MKNFNPLFLFLIIVSLNACDDQEPELEPVLKVDCSYNIPGTYSGTKVFHEQAGYTDTSNVSVNVTTSSDSVFVNDFPAIILSACQGEFNEGSELWKNQYIQVEFYEDSLYIYHGHAWGNPAEKTWDEYFLSK